MIEGTPARIARLKARRRCTHRMIEGTMDWTRPEPNDQFAHTLPANTGRH
jgi:hypothetical protein